MKLTTKEVAARVNLTPIRVVQLIYGGVIEAEKRGRDYLIDESQIEIIKNRPERRGKYKRKPRPHSLEKSPQKRDASTI